MEEGRQAGKEGGKEGGKNLAHGVENKKVKINGKGQTKEVY
jgi:hypothetical protein